MTTQQNISGPNEGGRPGQPLPPLNQQHTQNYGPPSGGYQEQGWNPGPEPGAPPPSFNFDSNRGGGGFQFRKPRRIWPYLVGLGVLGLLLLFAYSFCGSDEEEEEVEAEEREPTPTAVPEPTQDVAKLVARALADQPPVEVTRIVQVPVTRLVEGGEQQPPMQGQVQPPMQSGMPYIPPYPPNYGQLPLLLDYTPEHFQQEYVNCFNPRAAPDVAERVKWTALLDLSASAHKLWVAYYRDRSCEVPHDVAESFGEQRIAWLQNAIYGSKGDRNNNRNQNKDNDNDNEEEKKDGDK